MTININIGNPQGPAGPAGVAVAIAANTIVANNTNATANPSGITVSSARSLLNINNIDNTSDANKPVSSATQAALDGKANSFHAHGNITNEGAIGSTANLPLITGASGVVTVGSFGTTANTFCAGNDSRLSDARTPTAHTQAASTITGNFPGLTSVVAGGSVSLWQNNGYGVVSIGDVLGNTFEIINIGNWKIGSSNDLPIEIHVNGTKQLQVNDGSSVFTGELVWKPEASTSLLTNGQFTIEKVSNTEVRLKLRGSDGTSRSTTLTLS